MGFLAEYALWTVAPLPFLLPWLALELCRGNLMEALFPASWSPAFTERLIANTTLWLASYSTAFALYHGARRTRWSVLKYDAAIPDAAFIAGEVARSFGGVLILTGFQIFCIGSARTGAGVAAVLPPLAHLGAGVLSIAVWADLHFYLQHRLLHVPGLYKAVHRTHHTSTNVDPFSGLSFHPIEQCFYFSAMLVPGVPLWWSNLASIALVAWPIPAHFGYAPLDRHHWDHHQKFNYNYGSSLLWDTLLGTCAPAPGARLTRAGERRAAEARKQRALAVGQGDPRRGYGKRPP